MQCTKYVQGGDAKMLKGAFIGAMALMPLYGLDDYRCTDNSLSEVQAYKSASSFDEAFTQGKVEGDIRLAYINQNNHTTDPATKDDYATSIGGQLKYETAKFNNISAAASVFVSQKVSKLSGDRNKDELNGDFFDANKDSFAYLGEAYIDYGYKNFDLRIGRQKIDTPLNDRDDIRMLPNTFEAIMAGYGGIDDTVLIAGYINRWAGYDSGDDISKFKDVPGGVDANGNEKKGVYLAGVMNESIKNVALQAWYYGMDKVADVIYVDGIYGTEYDSGLSVEAGLQYANYAEKSSSTVDGNIIGGSLLIGYSGVSLSAAFNEAESSAGKSVILGFGGGPYFTSMEEMTVDSINDASARVFGAEVDFSKLVDGLSLAYAYGRFDGDAGTTKYEEDDLVLAYAWTDKSDFEISYADVRDKANSGADDTGYDRVLMRVNYYF